jgi:hypothetical protein
MDDKVARRRRQWLMWILFFLFFFYLATQLHDQQQGGYGGRRRIPGRRFECFTRLGFRVGHLAGIRCLFHSSPEPTGRRKSSLIRLISVHGNINYFFFFEIRVLDVVIIKFIIERVESSYWWKTSLGRRWWRSTSFARQCDADDGPGPCGLFIGMCQVSRSSDRWLCRHFPFWKCKKRFFSLIKKYPSIRYLSFCYSKKDWQTHLLENIPQNLCVF